MARTAFPDRPSARLRRGDRDLGVHPRADLPDHDLGVLDLRRCLRLPEEPRSRRDLSMESMNIFLDSDGVTDSLRRSIYVAVLTIVACLGIGTPAGYALARFTFRAANPFQLALVSTRAFPLIIIAVPLAVTYLALRHRRHHLRRRHGPRRLHAAADGARDGQRLRGDLVRAGGGGDDARVQPALGLSQGRAAARPARGRGGGDLRLRHDLERGLRGGAPDASGTGRCPLRCWPRSTPRRCRTASPAASSCSRRRSSSSSSSASTW